MHVAVSGCAVPSRDVRTTAGAAASEYTSGGFNKDSRADVSRRKRRGAGS